jgi:hypothetical protein
MALSAARIGLPQAGFSPAGFRARLGWSRIGSPGIFSEQTW